MTIVIGISGISCGGKTSLARLLFDWLSGTESMRCKIIGQDSYFHDEDRLDWVPHLNHRNWDNLKAIDWPSFEADIKRSLHGDDQEDVLIIEGFLIFANEFIRDRCDHRYWIHMDYADCFERRKRRTDYVPPDVPGYFTDVVWPEYLEHQTLIFDNRNEIDRQTAIQKLDGHAWREPGQLQRIKRRVRKLLHPKNWIILTNDSLSVEDATDFVTEPENGAISTFSGTTRSHFDGKSVEELEYECYPEMARQKIHELTSVIRNNWSQVSKIAILHRLGRVKVEEISVVIAVSSPHRKEAIEACHFAIDELKKTVPIWKKATPSNTERSEMLYTSPQGRVLPAIMNPKDCDQTPHFHPINGHSPRSPGKVWRRYDELEREQRMQLERE